MLVVMCAYLIYTGFAFPEISAALTTCFFVSLGSLGESVQKLTLRIAGALVGGVAAGLCIAFVRPSMTDIGQLTLLIGAGAGVCAWVAASSVHLSYMGRQMALAFLLGILQGYAPPSHFKVLFDRVFGIVLGNVLVTVIFSTVWPTSAVDRTRASMREALDELTAFVGVGTHRVGDRLAVLQSIDKARQLDPFAKFELRMLPKTRGSESVQGASVAELQRIAGLAFVAAELQGSEDPAAVEARARLRSELEKTHGVAW
jgi:multidrug resistance protein MdtO